MVSTYWVGPIKIVFLCGEGIVFLGHVMSNGK